MSALAWLQYWLRFGKSTVNPVRPAVFNKIIINLAKVLGLSELLRGDNGRDETA